MTSDVQPLWTLFRRTAVNPLIISSLGLFLYGLYILLFRISLVLLRKRGKTRGHSFHRVSLTTLFVLASIGVPLGMMFDLLVVAGSFWELARPGLEFPFPLERLQLVLQITRYLILFFMGFTVDCILIFRCYVIFGYRRRFFFVPLVLCIVIDLGAIITGIWDAVETKKIENDPNWVNLLDNIANSFLGASALFNFVLTGAIAGKVWSVLRGSLAVDEWTKRRFKTIVSIVLESGLLYSLTIAVMIVGNLLGAETFDIGSIMMQTSGIAPTLMIVRANISRGLEDEEEDQDTQFNLSTRFGVSTGSVTEREEGKSGVMVLTRES
ncbi:hypothetical protein E1B28_000025 [Marasmius oreades]|uniref:Uncharacterized protein n=1 Tax=Marasmius oreades TaxID=181124 RepID=A0A9P8ADR5_9AGAR|nr:uncharacterized protein E1B28_000025 [Marasmius oreades]KAG7098051.1 hypothetical protein E1B28_000025 [Marasmius oreades]